tara:strand:- start:183 stop:380 length:198 start_codon:yes stop_codon:yes gene_type:complete
MILQTNTNQYYGKKLTKVTDLYGNELSDLVMAEWIIFHFDDGSQLSIATDWRGGECYISQRTKED